MAEAVEIPEIKVEEEVEAPVDKKEDVVAILEAQVKKLSEENGRLKKKIDELLAIVTAKAKESNLRRQHWKVVTESVVLTLERECQKRKWKVKRVTDVGNVEAPSVQDEEFLWLEESKLGIGVEGGRIALWCNVGAPYTLLAMKKGRTKQAWKQLWCDNFSDLQDWVDAAIDWMEKQYNFHQRMVMVKEEIEKEKEEEEKKRPPKRKIDEVVVPE